MNEDQEMHPPGETVFNTAPGKLAQLAAANAQSIAQHMSTHEEKTFDPIAGRIVEKSSSSFNKFQDKSFLSKDTDAQIAEYTMDDEGYEKPKLLPPGLNRTQFIPHTLDSETNKRDSFTDFTRSKKFDNIYQEKADRVRRLHAGIFYKDPDRPIHASEIKSWFHAWLGKQHLSANYDYQSSMSLTETGEQQHTYTVECTVTGFKHTARARMQNKKDCQTASTWLMIDWMILNNHIDPRIIPFEKEDIYVDVKHLNLEGDENENQRTIYTKKMRFIAGGRVNPDGSEDFTSKNLVWAHSAPTAAEKAQKIVDQIFGGKSKPIGIEYLEFLQGSGKNKWHCRLCDTDVTDEAGKAMHVRGRKHKLNYKRFVDPDLGIGRLSAEEERILKTDVLEYQKTLAAEHKTKAVELEIRDIELVHHENLEDFLGTVYEDFFEDEREEYKKLDKTVEFKCPSLKHIYAHASTFPVSDDDKLVTKKLQLMKEETKDVISAKALTQLQDIENALIEVFRLLDAENPNASWMTWPHPIRRIGTHVKGIASKNDKDTAVEFVVICARHPTRELIQGVIQKLSKKLNPRESECVIMKQTKRNFYINYGKKMLLPVHFTSYKLFNSTSIIPRYYGIPLSRDNCIKYLMAVDRKTYFLKNMKRLPGYLDTLKILRDISNRSKAWENMRGWPLEVIVKNAIAGILNCSQWPSRNSLPNYEGNPMQPQPVSPHKILKRVFEYVGSGSLQLYGLLDPVELVSIERQVLKKLVGYDEHDVVTLEAGPEPATIDVDVTCREGTIEEFKGSNDDKNGDKKSDENSKEKATDQKLDSKPSRDENLSVPENKETPKYDEKPKAKKRERKSKFGKKAAEYSIAPVSTVKIVKKGDIASEDKETVQKMEDGVVDDPASKRPKMMTFVKAGENPVDNIIDKIRAEQEEYEKEHKDDLVCVDDAVKSGISKENIEKLSVPIAVPDETNTKTATDGTKSSGKHLDLVSSLRPQHLEDVTASSHTILRMLNFGWTHKVLGISANIITAMEIEELRRKEEAKRRAMTKIDLTKDDVNYAIDS